MRAEPAVHTGAGEADGHSQIDRRPGRGRGAAIGARAVAGHLANDWQRRLLLTRRRAHAERTEASRCPVLNHLHPLRHLVLRARLRSVERCRCLPVPCDLWPAVALLRGPSRGRAMLLSWTHPLSSSLILSRPLVQRRSRLQQRRAGRRDDLETERERLAARLQEGSRKGPGKVQERFWLVKVQERSRKGAGKV